MTRRGQRWIGQPGYVAGVSSCRGIALRDATHRLVEFDGLVHLSRETINQEPAPTIFPPLSTLGWVLECFPHGIFQELQSYHQHVEISTPPPQADS